MNLRWLRALLARAGLAVVPAPWRGEAADHALSLRGHLLALVLAVLLPTFAFAGAASWATLRSRATAVEARLEDSASAFATAIDIHIRAEIAALNVLAAASHLESTGDPGGNASVRFELLARQTASIFGTWVVMLAADGSTILNTATPAEMILAPAGRQVGPEAMAAVRRALRTGQPVVMDIARGPAENGGSQPNQFAAFIFVPVRKDGSADRVIGMPLLPSQMTALLAGAMPGQPGATALTDSRGIFVAHSRDATRLVGQQGPPRAPQDRDNTAGLMRGRSVADNTGLRIAWHSVASAPGWTLWANVPESVIAAEMRGPIQALVGGALLALVLGAVLARILSRRLLRPVDALVAHAEAVASGAPWKPAPARIEDAIAPSRVQEFERLRLAVTASETALRQAEAQYRRVQSIGRVGSFLVDLSQGEPSRSASLIGMERRPPRSDETSHQAWLARMHPDDRERADCYFRKVTADGAPDVDYVQDYRLLDDDGTVHWISARAEIERDSDGRALRMLGAHVDITALKQAEAALRDGEGRLHLALEAAGMGAWEADLRKGMALRTPRALSIFGFGPEHQIGIYPAWRDHVHPEDRAALAEAVDALRGGATNTYAITYRFRRPDGQWRWLEVRARAAERDPATNAALRMIGTVLDVTERREAEERQALLTREVDHRAKNALAIVNAALRLTPRDDPDAFASTVEGRVTALARAHTLLAEARWTGADLHSVVAGELGPFLRPNDSDASTEGAMPASGPVASVDGPAVLLGPTAVQALSMTFHELATNATKYGALSTPAGRLTINWSMTGPPEQAGSELLITWREVGEARIAGSPARRGFGSNLVEATIRRQLSGQLRVAWLAEGLLWEAVLPLERMLTDGKPPEPIGLRNGGARA